MSNFKKKPYILFLLISIIIFMSNLAKADELGIFLGAVSKHYCTCIFVSELEPSHCNQMLDNLMATTLENSQLSEVAQEMTVDVDTAILVISVSVSNRGVRSVFNGEKGCYLDTLN
jgi:hypothetical protein